MTWTYIDPSTSDRDKVRFLLGDINTLDQQLQDSEIVWLLSEWENNVYKAASIGAGSIGTHYARLAREQKQVGDLRLMSDYAHVSALYEALADKLWETDSKKNPPLIGFNPNSMVATIDRDPDEVVTTDFKMGLDDNPGGFGVDDQRNG